jgi:RNA polymerase sigma-70 factor, ECF subfamily
LTVLNELSDAELLRRMRAGNEEAFSVLYHRRRNGIYRFAMHMSGSKAVAEDVTQETFLTLLREGRSYDSGRGSVAAFLYGIARNHVLRRLERDRAGLPLQEDGEFATESDMLAELARNQQLEQLRKAVLALPARYREVVVLCDLEEMDYAAAATTLGCAVGTVRSRLHRARRLLSHKLGAVRQARCLA